MSHPCPNGIRKPFHTNHSPFFACAAGPAGMQDRDYMRKPELVYGVDCLPVELICLSPSVRRRLRRPSGAWIGGRNAFARCLRAQHGPPYLDVFLDLGAFVGNAIVLVSSVTTWVILTDTCSAPEQNNRGMPASRRVSHVRSDLANCDHSGAPKNPEPYRLPSDPTK